MRSGGPQQVHAARVVAMINTSPIIGPVERTILTMGPAQGVLSVQGRAFSENTPVTDEADLDSLPREV